MGAYRGCQADPLAQRPDLYDRPGYWLLVRPEPDEPGRVTTRAFVQCFVCRKPLAPHGGPRDDALCDDCLATIRRVVEPPRA